MSRRNRHVSVDIQPYAQPAVPLAWPAVQQGPVRIRSSAASPCVLVGAVGYRNLRDMSAGPLLLDRLREMGWPEGVELEDLSFGAVHVLHWLQERTQPFTAAVLISAVKRGAVPGTVSCGRWRAPETSAEAVQERIAEAVTGVISLDTLLIVLGYFEALPDQVALIEIEPRDDDWGPELSDPVAAALDRAADLVRDEVARLRS